MSESDKEDQARAANPVSGKKQPPGPQRRASKEKRAEEPKQVQEDSKRESSSKGKQSSEEESAGEMAAASQSPTAAELLKDEFADIKIRRAKGSKNIHSGLVHILATFNNTKVSFTDKSGNLISWSTAGKCGFRGSRKSTAYAAQIVTQDAGRAAMGHGLREVEVRVKGPGMGRDSAVRALQSLGLTVLSITDVTPVPHNGCRPPKRRRL
jgi:small subunit ribosomal protein S11